ncbi:MAG: hypothetical protein WAV45_15275 [Propionibacteriaceae bacterium]|nr:hypothetical protein [Micropruina sp.]HBX80323.1 hypothetical protein [Propionibacteriaceae bacterium]HBY21771.1 hypothetical protein [Propionibacteriaceae bacterium]
MKTVAWVDAAPFRAHVRHLCASADLPWEVVASRAGVSTVLVDHLLHGRGGRTVLRLAPHCASKLLGVTPAELRDLRHRVVDATDVTAKVRALLAQGAPATSLATFCRMTAGQLVALGSARSGSCTELTAALVGAAEARWVARATREAA